MLSSLPVFPSYRIEAWMQLHFLEEFIHQPQISKLSSLTNLHRSFQLSNQFALFNRSFQSRKHRFLNSCRWILETHPCRACCHLPEHFAMVDCPRFLGIITLLDFDCLVEATAPSSIPHLPGRVDKGMSKAARIGCHMGWKSRCFKIDWTSSWIFCWSGADFRNS